MFRIPKLAWMALFGLVILSACAGGDFPSPSPTAAEITVTSTVESRPTPTVGSGCIRSFSQREEAQVTKVTDGDSITVEMRGVEFQVRYIGMDAPEMTGEPLARESRETNVALVEGKRVVLIRDISEADRYGRLLRFVFTNGVFVNREIVRLGLARAKSYQPDVGCDAEVAAAQAEAQKQKRGLWGMIPTEIDMALNATPGSGCAGGCPTPPPGCLIKGNINSKGEKIYHVPGGRSYKSTVIEPEKGERWFCTEEDAVAAGWRRSKT